MKWATFFVSAIRKLFRPGSWTSNDLSGESSGGLRHFVDFVEQRITSPYIIQLFTRRTDPNQYQQISYLQLIQIAIILLILPSNINASYDVVEIENHARYDHYRLYRVQLETDRHVQLFQDLEAKSDSSTFFGHARQPGQQLTITVAANKVSDFDDFLDRFLVKGRVLEYNV
ncbi:zinc carboxypeptidase A 1-like [Armigeres subalbatus]|uniref:zinc carboxypeptidase A 1-like n=1 Tax=Armigeres subalbatus TaxID=124917 RepID=UPI002ED669AD